MKRIFSLCMTILAVACVQNVVNAEDGFTEQSKTQLFSSQEEVLDAWGGFSEQEQEDYAGMYMTDNGELVIQFKADSSSYTYAVNKMTKQRNVLRNTEQTMSQSIIVEEATYTYDTLKDAYGIVVENAYDYDGVKSISFSNKDNCLYVGVLNNVDKEYLKVELLNILCREMSLDAFCSYKDFVNQYEDIIKFKELGDTFESDYSASTTINGYSGLYYYDDDGRPWEFSAAIGYYSDEYGSGFITTGHAPQKDDYVWYDGVKIGKIKKVNHDGKDDTAFAKFTSSSYSWENISADDEILYNKTPIENGYIYIRGRWTNPSEWVQVIDTMYSYRANDGYVWSELIAVDYYGVDGDSGGAAYSGKIDAGRTTCVIGVISANVEISGGLDHYVLIVPSKNIERY